MFAVRGNWSVFLYILGRTLSDNTHWLFVFLRDLMMSERWCQLSASLSAFLFVKLSIVRLFFFNDAVVFVQQLWPCWSAIRYTYQLCLTVPCFTDGWQCVWPATSVFTYTYTIYMLFLYFGYWIITGCNLWYVLYFSTLGLNIYWYKNRQEVLLYSWFFLWSFSVHFKPWTKYLLLVKRALEGVAGFIRCCMDKIAREMQFIAELQHFVQVQGKAKRSLRDIVPTTRNGTQSPESMTGLVSNAVAERWGVKDLAVH